MGEDSEATCCIVGCTNPIRYKAARLCFVHYQRNRKTGSFDKPIRQTTPWPDRFWAKVDRCGAGGCWLWTGSIGGRGYGLFSRSLESGTELTHRLSWALRHKEIPSGLHVLHRCDNPPCVNPDHLFLGSQLDNMRDKVAKGRQARGPTHGSQVHPESRPRGARHHAAKLSAEQVVDLRARRAAGAGLRDLAAHFGITARTVHDVATRKTWREEQ